MMVNKPGDAYPEPQPIQISEIDPVRREQLRASVRAQIEQFVQPEDIIPLVHALYPNKPEDLIVLDTILNSIYAYSIANSHFDVLARKINPHSICGSHAIVMLQEAGALSTMAEHELRQRINVTLIDYLEEQGEFGSTLSNLFESGLIEIRVPGQRIGRSLGFEDLN